MEGNSEFPWIYSPPACLPHPHKGELVTTGNRSENARKNALSAYNTINHAIANDAVNASSVRGGSLTTLDEFDDAVDTISTRGGSNTNTGISNKNLTEGTPTVGKKVNESLYKTSSDFAGVGVSKSCIDIVAKSVKETKPDATRGNTLETKISVSGSGIIKGADVDALDVAIEENSDNVAVPAKDHVKKLGRATVTIGVTDSASDGEKRHATCNGCFETSKTIGIGR